MQLHQYLIYAQTKRALIVFLCMAYVPFIIVICSSALYAQKTAVWEDIDTVDMQYFGNWQYHEVLGVADENHYAVIGTENKIPLGRLVRRTNDGGQTWRTVFYDTAGPLQGEIWQEHWTYIAHPAPDIIVVVGYRSQPLPNPSNENTYTGFYHITYDGGITWNRRDLDSNSRPGALSMCDAMHGVMVMQVIGNRDNPEPDTRPDHILRTTDGWQTFSAFDLPIGITFCEAVVCPEPNVYILLAFNADLGEMRVYRTTDGGVNWQESETLPEGLGGLNLAFINSLVGWTAGSVPTGIGDTRTDIIAKTTDGGMTWNVQLDSLISPAFGLSAIDFADQNHGLAVGFGSKILRTRDGGQSWVQEFAPTKIKAPSLRFLAYPREDLAIAMYAGRPIMKYSGRETLLAPTFIAPTGFERKQVNNLMVEWTPITGATEYYIQIAPKKISGFNVYDSTVYRQSIVDSVMTGTSLILNDLQYNYCYYGRVKALNGQEISDWREESCLFLTIESQNTILPPRILQPENGAVSVPTTVMITWESVANAVSYDVQVSEGERRFLVPDLIIVDESGLTDTSLILSDLKPDTEYFIRTRVHTADRVSAWSSVIPHPFRTAKVTGITEEVTEMQAVRIIPHPVSNRASVFIGGLSYGAEADIALYDVMGVQIMSLRRRITPATEVSLDLRNVPNGIYMLHIVSGRTIVSKRLYVVK